MSEELKTGASIYLDLDQADFDEFDPDSGIQLSQNNSVLWQVKGYDRACELLKNHLKDAKNYFTIREKHPKAALQNIHNAILVSGPRGSGKTVFIRNIKHYWNLFLKENVELKKADLFFCPVIDPTLLVNNDEFHFVIIAHIFNEVKKFKNGDFCPDSEFIKSLRKLSKALEEDKELMGIDQIAQYTSGIEIEKYFQEYIFEALKEVRAKAFVVLIDDIDMALDRAYEVLDVVRRLLSCPYIIPIVSGNYELYEDIVGKEFYGKLNSKRMYFEEQVAKDKAKNLSLEYLRKVLPFQMRIDLEGMDVIKYRLRIHRGGEINSYSDLLSKFENKIFNEINNNEGARNWKQPSSARQLVQFAKKFLANIEQEFVDWEEFEHWSYQNEDYSTYILAKTEALLRSDHFKLERLDQLPAFNPKMQLTDKVACFDFYSDLQEHKNFNEGKNFFTSFVGKRLYSTMPLPEFENSRTRITLAYLKNFIRFLDNQNTPEHEKKTSSFIFHLYSFKHGYGNHGKTSYQFFFGRVFELIYMSLLSYFDLKLIDKKQFLRKLFSRNPFYSQFSFSPTKNSNLIDDSDISDEMEEGKEFLFLDDGIDQFLLEWEKWEKETKSKSIFLESYQKQAMIRLLSKSFNKIFTQISHLIQIIEKQKGFEESILSLHHRFEYITVSAFASYLNPDAINVNVGISSNIEVILNPRKYISKNQYFRKNLIDFLNKLPYSSEVDNSLDIPSELYQNERYPINSNAQSLWGWEEFTLWLICSHPLFSTNMNQSVTEIISFPLRRAPLNDEIPSSPLINHSTLQAIKDNFTSFRILERIATDWKWVFKTKTSYKTFIQNNATKEFYRDCLIRYIAYTTSDSFKNRSKNKDIYELLVVYLRENGETFNYTNQEIYQAFNS